MNDEQKRKIEAAKRAEYSELVKSMPGTWSATHVPIYQPEVSGCTDIHKKCMCCGKTYTADTSQKYCSCKAHGYLYAAGYLYRKKGGEAIGQRNPSPVCGNDGGDQGY